MKRKTTIAVGSAIALGAILSAAACTYEVGEPTSVDGDTASAGPSVATADQAPAPPSEGETIGAMRAVVREQTAEAEVGRARSFTPLVFFYAEGVLIEDETMRARQEALVARLGIAPDDGPWVTTREPSEDATRRLAQLEGPSFDVAYLERQAAASAEMLALVDVLVARPMSDELRVELGKMRTTFSERLSRARALASHLSLDGGYAGEGM